MVHPVYEKQKIELQYSKKQVAKAGRALRKGVVGEEREEAIKVIQAFRASHSHPLTLIKNHLVRHARNIDENALIARRLKRLPTIIDKLERETLDGVNPNQTDIRRMQDIGGCRAILSSPTDVEKLKDSLFNSRSVHKLTKVKDYMQSPKDTGYRGVHLVYSCYGKDESTSPWKGHKIEVQLRTRLQHAWATAVEMVDLFDGTNLKTGMVGNEKWRRFFFLMGHVISDTENIKVCSNQELRAYIQELAELNVELNAYQRLKGYQMITPVAFDSNNGEKGYTLITLKRESDSSFIATTRFFRESKRELAIHFYDLAESNTEYELAVLVATQGADSLKKAYPNYFADTELFLKLLADSLL